MEKTIFIVRSSYADIHVDRSTGRVLSIDYEAMGGTDQWDDVDMFDPSRLTDPNGEDDCLNLRFRTKERKWLDMAEIQP